MILEYKEEFRKHTEEESSILQQYTDALETQRIKTAEENTSQNKQFEESELQLKEEELKLERNLSHLLLDRDHISKNKTVLDDEIQKKTKTLTQQKDELIESRTNIQVSGII